MLDTNYTEQLERGLLAELEPALVSLEFGLKSVEHLPFDRLNVFTQTRKSYPEEAMQELVRSIEALDETGTPRNQLLHPPFVNILDRENAEKYLNELNTCHKTNHTLDEAVALDDGRYAIIVAGHRRRLAVGRIIQKQGGDPATSTIASNVAYNLTFAEALQIQIEENTHLQLPIYDLARAIQSTYRYGIESGQFKSVADCVRALPYGEEKVRNALRFCELPTFLQDWVEDERISYGVGVALFPVMGALRQKYAAMAAADREEIVVDSMMTWTLRIMANRWGKDKVTEQVTEFIDSQNKINNLQLFTVDEKAMARRQRQQAYHDLFRGGLGSMRSFVALASQAELFRSLPPEQQEAVLEELGSFIRELGSLATRAEEPQLFG